MEIWKNELPPLLDGYVVNEQMICFFISDGRALSLSRSLIPELAEAGHDALRNCQPTADNLGLYWPEYDLTLRFGDYL